MKNLQFSKIVRSSVSLFAAVSLLVGTAPAVFAAEGKEVQTDSLISLRDDLKVNYQDYVNSDVMFQMPEGMKEDEEVSVIIRYDLPTLMDAYEGTDKVMSMQEFATTDEAAEVIAAIDARREAILATLDEQGVEYKLGEQYNALFAGFELLIKGGDYTVTCMSMADGEEVVVGNEYKPQEAQLVENEVNVYETGIFNASDVPYDGTGMVVAVLDTGLDSNHTAFSTDNFTSEKLGMTYDDVAKLIKKTKAYEWADGLSVDDVYINEKVPFGYDYADNDPDVYSTHNNHGTHVSGVIVGKDDTITGVAPNAQLVSMKIFSDVEDSAMSSWILAALEDCVILGVDVVNMSLGTACGFSHETEEELLDGVYDRLRDAGIAVVVAASNSYNSAYGSEANGNLPLTSNPDSATVGSPGTYSGTMSVASVNGVETPYIKFDGKIIYFDEANDNAGKEKNFFETLLGDQESMKVEFVTVPGVGRSADYTGLDVSGKIALVRRGSNTFEEKALIAEAQGAIGIIIYNNVSGDIKMNIGDATLAVCSISQDDGEVLAAAGNGTINIDKEQTSGPFMSDFSSWGPTPSLGIKPEIAAHGGNILSSVTGGGYDRLCGTSMACPNIAGATVLMHQYVVENFPEIADNNKAVTALVNRLMMSTADVIINTNGKPYAVRKQGAGLANLTSATTTPAAIMTYDKDGKEMDTAKLELGDDPDKTGVYEMTFAVDNFSDKSLTYQMSAYVLTEGVSDTKTNAGETTVTEQAVELEGAKVEIVSVENGTKLGDFVMVKGGEQAKLTVKIALSDKDKQYLDESFENGMYVEGFIQLKAVLGTKVDLSVPYLAFYGDWTAAPMFDLEYYDTNADELNEGIDPEDKLMADAFPSRAVGGISADYVSYLGSYYFVQDPADMVISASRDYIALSNQEGAISSLRFVWAGMLRAANSIDITITDDATGKVIFETTEKDIRKSYGDGGTIRPSNIEIEFNMKEYNLPNNSKLTVKLVGHMDYGEDGGVGTNRNYTMEFPMTVDFEAPTVSDVEYYYEYDKTAKKNRLYAKLAVYDNHYAMSGQLGYVIMGKDENDNDTPELLAFEQYMTPIYSKENSTTYVTLELTDYIYQIKDYAMNKNSFVFTAYDYCLNYASYEIRLPDSFESFYFEGLDEGLTLSPNEVYTIEPFVTPDNSWGELLDFRSSKPSVVRVVNNKLVAVKKGIATIRVDDPTSKKKYSFTVKVLGEGDEGYRRYDKSVADMFILTGYTTQKAYYILENEDKDIGDTGAIRFFEGKYNLSMYPSESVSLMYDLDPFYPRDTTIEYESSNENIVKVTAAGVVTAVAEGFASVTVKVMQDGKSTYYSESVSVEVKDPYDVTGGILNHYYGLGGLVEIPARLKLKEIGNFAFANFDYVEKTAEELERDDREATKQWYIGDATVTKVVIPEGVEKIGAYAFANLTALEEVVLPSTLTAIEYGAFVNCTALKKISFSSENNVQIINQNAFEKCNLEGKLEWPSACVISDYAFAGNKKLKEVVTGDSLLSIGQYAFAGCEKIESVTVTAKLVKYGAYAFTGCESLKKFNVNALVLPEGMFYQCEDMTEVTVGPDVNEIGEFAFLETGITTIEVQSDNKAFKSGKNPYVLSKSGKTLVAVAPTLKGKVTAATFGDAKITEIAGGAFSHNKKVTQVVLPEVTKLGDYAFGSSKALKKVTLGELTDIGEYAFFETAITKLPKFTVKTEIGRYAFAFTAITEVNVPDKMEVAEGVFSECSKLKKVTIGDDVKLGKYAFGMDKDSVFKVERKDIDGKRYFYYVFHTNLKSVTIGKNVEIGETAFTNHASLEKVTLGEGAKLGKMAFYNNASLKEINLSGVTELGDYALSGDVYNMCLDDQMTVAAVDKTGHMMYTYHAPLVKTADLSSAKEIGEYAFAYCREMKTVKLSDKIDEIKKYTFAGCSALKSINLAGIKTVGEYAFSECGSLAKADLSSAKEIGEFAFVYNRKLKSVTFNTKGATLGEGAFSYCDLLKTLKNMGNLTEIGDYAFAYSALTSADLTDAVKIGDHAFLKEEYTEFKVTLGKKLESLGNNPFAMCKLAPFSKVEESEKDGKKTTETITTYDISRDVTVVDGSLYCKVPNGLELITYLGTDPLNAVVAEDTVRVSAMAFTGNGAKLVTLPGSVVAIGHKAFYECKNLELVMFQSYNAPVLEEEYDPSYYETYTHMPGVGDYGTYTDYEGNEVAIIGEGIVPYFMWNATGGMYSNVFYGANFKNYVGYVKNKVAMIRPTNGVGYDNYIYSHYFKMQLDGTIAADPTTVAAIKAIAALPTKATEEHRALVEAARAAYNKIPTVLQQGLVSNYADLVTAEQRLAAQDAEASAPAEDTTPEKNNGWVLWLIIGLLAAGLLALIALLIIRLIKGTLTLADIGNWFKAIPGNIVKFVKAIPGAFMKFIKGIPGFFKALPGNLKRFGLWLWAVLKKAWALILAAVALLVTLWKKVAPVVSGFFKKLIPAKKKAPVEETAEETPAEEAVEAPVEEVVEETPAEAVPAVALNESANPVIVETPAEEIVEETPVEETIEEAPVEEIVEEAPVKAPKKPRKPFPWRMIGLGLLAVAGVAAVVALVIALLGMRPDPTPYEQNDLDSYTVSVRYDANGGIFTTNSSVIVDSYNLEGMTPGSDGKVSIALLAPNDSNRGTDAFEASKSGYLLAGWYAGRTKSGTDADGNPVYTYSQPWDFTADTLQVAADGTYSATEPQLTLYAAWVPRFEVQFYDRSNPDELIGTYVCKAVGGELTVPAWNEETGAMDMHDFPVRAGYTFEKAYLDAAGKQPVTAATITHTGKVNADTGVAEGAVMKVYTDWTEGEWYHIYTAEQFADNASVTGSYVLHADLDFSEENWPSSLMYGTYTGTIKGNGHVIKNVTLSQTNNSKLNAGLFGVLGEGAKLEDLTFENVTFEIKKGARMAGTAYGLLCGTLDKGADITGLIIKDGHLTVDSDCYFATDDYVIGLLCGIGNAGEVDLSGITCAATGKTPDRVKITVVGNTVTLEFVD